MFTRIVRTGAVLGLTALIGACGTPAVAPLPTTAPTTVLVPTTAPAPTVVLMPTTAPERTVDLAAIDAFVNRMLAAYDVPGAAIAVVLPDGSTYTKGYGVRDVTTSAPVTPNTQFAIASSTKSFTALGVMLLVEEGKIDLDAPVTDYLPNFSLSDPAQTPNVTVRHLLLHTSGMVRNNAATGNPTITRDEVVGLAAITPLNGAPGELHEYSNVNTVIAARIIEVVTGQSWEEFTRERILTPLGMDTTTLNTEDLQQQPDFAMPHERDLLTGMAPGAFINPGAEAPAAAVNAGAEEMVRYLQFQLGDGTVNGTQLLSAANLAEMHRAQVELRDTGPVSESAWRAAEQGVPAPLSLTSDYGYGFYWYTEDFRGERVAQHDGHGPGFTANISLAPDAEVGVAVMANGNYTFGFVEAVRSFVLEELLELEHTPDMFKVMEDQLALAGRDQASVRAPSEAVRAFTPDAAQLEALAGSYTNLAAPEPATVTVVDANSLQLDINSPMGPLNLRLLPVSDTRFLINTPPYRGFPVEFIADAEGTLVQLNGFDIARR
jgi:CubicO group peptidase (beta-lactamase class C family)